MSDRRIPSILQVGAASVQVTSGAASALVTIPNAASGDLAQAVRVASKGGAYILPQVAPFAVGSITVSALPANNDTLTVNGTAITFKTSGATGNQINIAADINAMAKAIAAFLQTSADTNIDDARYTIDLTNNPLVINVTHRTAGTGGNSFTLAKSSSGLAVSGATLSGGANGTAAAASNSIYVPANQYMDLWVRGQNAIAYIQESAASIINISPLEVA